MTMDQTIGTIGGTESGAAPGAVDPDALHTWCALVRSAVSPEGRDCDRWRRTSTGEIGDPRTHPRAVPQLRSWIYRDVHLGGEPPGATAPSADAAVLALLTELATGTWTDPGWKAERTVPPEWLVAKRGVRLRVTTDELHGEPDGDTVALRLPRARPGALFGWFGYTGPDGPARGPRARLYLHLPSPADRGALSVVLASLERLNIRWQAKAAVRDTGRSRADAFVVYLDVADVTHAVDVLWSSSLPSVLVDPVPGFSVRIDRGMGLAVHPPGLPAGSFGARLADLFARTLVEYGADDLEARIAAVLDGPGAGGHDGGR